MISVDEGQVQQHDSHNSYDSFDDYNHWSTPPPRVKLSPLQQKVALWKKSTMGTFAKWVIEQIPGGNWLTTTTARVSTVVHVILDTVFLPFEAIHNIKLWFNGEISGKRCAKSLVDASAAIAGGIGGAALGASLGSIGGLIGSVIGGAIGGLFGGSAARSLVSYLTERIFDLPTSIAVERAYNYLRLSPSSHNYEINRVFRILSKLYHPDRNRGDAKDFIELQTNMQLIVEDRKRTGRF